MAHGVYAQTVIEVGSCELLLYFTDVYGFPSMF